VVYRKRGRRIRVTPEQRILNSHLCLLEDEEPPLDSEHNRFAVHGYTADKARKLWALHGALILAKPEWKDCRPLAWYFFECPRTPPFELPERDMPCTWAQYPGMRPSPAMEKAFLEGLDL